MYDGRYGIHYAPEPPLTVEKFVQDMVEQHAAPEVVHAIADKLIAEGKFSG